jgi:hypothetical protein
MYIRGREGKVGGGRPPVVRLRDVARLNRELQGQRTMLTFKKIQPTIPNERHYAAMMAAADRLTDEQKAHIEAAYEAGDLHEANRRFAEITGYSPNVPPPT